MWPILCIALGCACVVLLAVDAIPYVMTWLHRHGTAEAMGIVAAAAIVLGSFGILLGPSTIACRNFTGCFTRSPPCYFGSAPLSRNPFQITAPEGEQR
jgi:hypothetical protein